MKTIQLSEQQLKTVVQALDVCYNKGVENIAGLRQIGISENTVNAYINEISVFADVANEINEQTKE